MIESVPDEAVTRIDEHAKTLYGRSGTSYAADVVNLIPPQRAGSLAIQANLTGDDGHWCPVEPDTFESIRQRNIHVIGDAAQASLMPKSGYSANNHAKAYALNLANRILGRPTVGFSGINVCYIGLSASETASFAAVYAASDNQFVTVPGVGGVSPLDMPFTRRERNDAESWFRSIKVEMTT